MHFKRWIKAKKIPYKVYSMDLFSHWFTSMNLTTTMGLIFICGEHVTIFGMSKTSKQT